MQGYARVSDASAGVPLRWGTGGTLEHQLIAGLASRAGPELRAGPIPPPEETTLMMAKRSRILILMASARCLGCVYVLPVWTISLEAPQYPEGLGMVIRSTRSRARSRTT
jgi:hypothetical protein